MGSGKTVASIRAQNWFIITVILCHRLVNIWHHKVTIVPLGFGEQAIGPVNQQSMNRLRNAVVQPMSCDYLGHPMVYI